MIEDWKQLENLSWENLLLGNGFSIGISKKFRYDSLLTIVDEHKIQMYPQARELFDEHKIATTNFEEVLKVIYHALLVNYWNVDAIKSLYLNVRKSLIDAVNVAHVPYSGVPLELVEKSLSGYKKIFTTNYDLIPYWSIMNKSFVGYCDYFWNDDCEFDPSNTEIWGNETPIFYLHGAIHLRTTADGTTKKIRATGETSIKDIIGETQMDNIPLFISEGKSAIKLRRIRENDYLNFCYTKLMNVAGNMVVFGHGLDKEFDEHILSALKTSQLKSIAISVYSNMSKDEKQLFVSKIKVFFAGTTIKLHFFESATHPLSLS